ncbi:MAG TPA: hypothetical protein VF148_06025 [Acidimicrobiia bacterium]
MHEYGGSAFSYGTHIAIEHALGLRAGSITPYPVSPAWVREALHDPAVATR